MFLPNIIILNRHCRQFKLAIKFRTLYCIYSFIMIILYYSFTDCCAVKISVGSLSDLGSILNNNRTLHLYCFQAIKHFQRHYLILFDFQNDSAGKEGQYICVVQKKTETDKISPSSVCWTLHAPLHGTVAKVKLCLPIGAQERRHQNPQGHRMGLFLLFQLYRSPFSSKVSLSMVPGMSGQSRPENITWKITQVSNS